VAYNKEVIHHYFDLLHETLEYSKISDKPAQIFNCNKTGMSFSLKPGKAAAGAGLKHPYGISAHQFVVETSHR
jgi:hypothetical protein